MNSCELSLEPSAIEEAYQTGARFLDGVGASQDFARAADLFETAASEGHAEAQYQLGRMHAMGLHGARDDVIAAGWFRAAAAQGSGKAESALGVLTLHGLGDCTQDDEEAVALFRRAAAKGVVIAQRHLADLQLSGRGGLAKDEAEARRWLERAAHGGDAEAQNRLGDMFFYGQGGLSPSDTEAVRWWRLAAEQKLSAAQYNMGGMSEHARGGLRPEDAAGWYHQAALQGNPSAQVSLGQLHEFGAGGVDMDKEEAVAWYRLAAGQNDPEGECCLGLMYENGTGVVKNLATAAVYYRRAANRGHARAQYCLGDCYDSGVPGLDQDSNLATQYFRKAAEQGHAEAQFRLGCAYMEGRGVRQDNAEAAGWFLRAAEQGYSLAQHNLGVFYMQGKGVPYDPEEAVRWYRQAADQSDADSNYALAACYDNGTGVNADLVEAFRLYQQGAQANHVPSFLAVGYAHHHGEGTPQDLEAAARCYLQTFQAGDSRGALLLGQLRARRDFRGDKAKLAVLWLERAARTGNGGAMMALGLRYLIGRDVPENWWQAADWLGRARAAGHEHVWLAELEALAGAGHPSWTELEANWVNEIAQSRSFATAAGALRSESQLLRLTPAQRLWRQLRGMQYGPSLSPADWERLASRLRLEVIHCQLEKKPENTFWYACLLLAQMGALGWPYEEVARSVQRAGPLFNRLDDRGCPVPADFVPASAADRNGLNRVTGLRVGAGQIELLGEPAETEMPMVTRADFDVALYLAFGNTDGAVWPSFSLEDTQEAGDRWRFDLKQFTPNWLGSTAYGRSLFHADYLMKNITADGCLQSLLDPLWSTAMDSAHHVPPLIRRIANCGGENPEASGRLEIMLRSITTERLPWTWMHLHRGEHWMIRDIHVAVDASCIRHLPDGGEDRTVRPNDPMTSPGRRGMLLTKHYAEIARLFPVFERVRQLLALTRLLVEVRESGFQPSGALRRRLDKLAKVFLASGKREECLLVPKAFHRGGCLCFGGVSMRGAKVEDVKKGGGDHVYWTVQREDGGIYKCASGSLGKVEGKPLRDRGAQRSISAGTGRDAGHIFPVSQRGAPGLENLDAQNRVQNRWGAQRIVERITERIAAATGQGVRAFGYSFTPAGREEPLYRKLSWLETSDDGSTRESRVLLGNFPDKHTRKAKG